MKEALKLALEALEANQPVNYCLNNNGEQFPMMQEDPFRFERNTKAIAAIKEALAQPEQQPVAWEQFHEHLVERNFCPRCGKRLADLTAIHTCTPPIAADPKAFHGFPNGSVSTSNAGGKCVTDGETSPSGDAHGIPQK